MLLELLHLLPKVRVLGRQEIHVVAGGQEFDGEFPDFGAQAADLLCQ